jgi:hyperosmotically inducible protein
MQRRILGRLLAGVLLAGGIAGASTKPDPNIPQTDDQIVKNVRHEILMYPYYSIWDDISFRVVNGQVELMGAVNQPFKKTDIERMVQKVPGVTSVADEIKVLPLSPFDDRIRMQVARAIYRDPVLSRYAMGAIPAIHIIVDNGHVTLTGVVSSEMEKNVAGIRASGAGLSFGTVNNQIQVEHPSSKKS